MDSSLKRREILINFMKSLEGQSVNCFSCQGTCCTSVANSMQITPLEAKDILDYLRKSGRHTDLLKKKLQDCIKDYRLDYEIPTTRGMSFRKTYTCPFFEPGPKGCSIPKEVNPYGCLGFNPKIVGVRNGGNCAIKEDISLQREQKFLDMEKLTNLELKARYNLHWDKISIPQALLSLWSEGSI